MKPISDATASVLDSCVCFPILKGERDASNWFRKNQDKLALTDVVVLELCRGIKGRQDRKLHFLSFIRSLPVLKTQRDDIVRAKKCLINWDVRKHQDRPRLPDLVIAQCAIGKEFELLTFDNDFDHIPDLKLVKNPFPT